MADSLTTADEKTENAPEVTSLAEISFQYEQTGDVENYILSGTKLHILLPGLGLAVFLMALDMSIISTAIPSITEKFHSTEDIGWCVLQPLSGKLYSNFSLKWTFLVLFLLFEIGSAISGAATSSEMLIVGRAIAGSGAAGMMSGTLSITAVVIELRLRALYTGVISSMFGIALICGPLLGGALTEHVSWRWIFYNNLPLGIVTIGALVFFFNPPERKVENETISTRIARLDPPGVAAFVPAIFVILLTLQWGGIQYPWQSGTIVGLFIGGGIMLVGFGFYQVRRGDMAMIPARILTNRTVLTASLTTMLAIPTQSIMGLWLPEWFQIIKEASPTQSVINLVPTMLAQTVFTIVGGALTSCTGYYNPWLLSGTALLSIGSGLFTTFQVTTKSAVWIGCQMVFDAGQGLYVMAPLLAVQTVLSSDDTPVGIATVTFFQMFGGSLFAAISQTVFNDQLLRELASNVPDIDVPMLLAVGTTGVREFAAAEQLPDVLESYNAALMNTFYLTAACSALATLVVLFVPWNSMKGRQLNPAGA